MKPYTEKYHNCKYCKKDNTYRIYYRSAEKNRQYIAFAWYCMNCRMFESDEASHKNRERYFRLEHNMKPEEDYYERLEREAELLHQVLRSG